MSKLNRREFIELSSKGAMAAGVPGLAKAEEWMTKGLPGVQAPGNGGQAGNNAKSAQSVINLPKGGGAVRGIGETFQANPFTGTGNFSVPIATSPGRGNFGPQLSLQYSTGQGNGPFGMGWSLSAPNVSRKTEKGVPQYEGKDVFLLSGAEDLVKVITGTRQRNGFTITSYRPRVEGLFARIEYWEGTNPGAEGQSFWKITTKENITNIYGYSRNAQLAHPDKDKQGQVFQWMLELTYEPKGNYVYYSYLPDLLDDLPDEIYESSREKGAKHYQLYLKGILYGNKIPLPSTDFQKVQNLLSTEAKDAGFEDKHFFKVLFDYGEHGASILAPDGKPQAHVDVDIFQPKNLWSYRQDAFSTYRSGFEIRTARLCKRVLMFHRVPDYPEWTLVRSTDFTHEYNKHSGVAVLKAVTQRGYRRVPAQQGKWYKSEEIHLGGAGVQSQVYQIKSLPPLEFGYAAFEPEKQTFREMTAEAGDMPPVGLRDSNTALVDLFGAGLQDILQTTDFGFYYWKNLGKHTFSRRRKLETMPAGMKLEQDGIGFGNMSGKGQADILVHQGPAWGYFEADTEQGWKDFRAYRQYPSFQLNDPNVRMVDLTGDGKADVMRTDQQAFVYFSCLGEAGFDEPRYQRRQFDLDVFPDVYFSDPRVRLVDMTGDGLQDIVLVHSGRIDYWPNMGHGKFGKRVTMKNVPRIDSRLDPSRLFLFDIDGSGPADMVYVEDQRVRFWFNQSGNGWSEEFSIEGTPAMYNLVSVELADMLGNGSTGLLWSSDYSGPGRSHYLYLDFTGGVKPNILIEMRNNMGAATKVQYKPSTYFYLEDLEAGNSWVSSLPLVVQVVEKVEKIDYVSKTKLVTTYQYHHGFYDGTEREFRGFAQVDQEDTEGFEQFGGTNLNVVDTVKNAEKGFYVPPVRAKIWFHTGVFDPERVSETFLCCKSLEELPIDVHTLFARDYYRGDPEARDLPNGVLDLHELGSGRAAQLDLTGMKEAYRALRGQMLRQEVYAEDGIPGKSEHPYTVTESDYRVRIVQPKADNPHPVFFSYLHESLTYHYERNPADPRIAQSMTLAVDQYGNVTDSVSIGYPRRPAIPNRLPEQTRYLATYSKNAFISVDDPLNNPETFYNGIPCESRTYELHGLAGQFGLTSQPRWLTHADFKNAVTIPEQAYHKQNEAGYYKRLLNWSQSYFRKDSHPQEITVNCPAVINQAPSRSNDAGVKLPLGQIGDLGLPFESYEAVFTNELIQQVFGAAVSDEMLRIAGYVFYDNIWWIPSGQQAFDPALFYQVKEQADAFGCRTEIRYHPHFRLTAEYFKDAVGNETSAKIDFITLQPFEIVDPNGNYTRVKFDALGFVAGSGVLSNDGTEGDPLTQFEAHREYTKADFHDHIDDPYGQNAVAVLSDAGSCQLNDLWIAKRKGAGTPPVVYSIRRENHQLPAQSGSAVAVQRVLMYFDSFGREIQTKVEAEPPPGTQTLRWIASGWKLYNNKGKVAQQYEPFYSGTPAYEGEKKEGVSSTLFYDPVERVICTVHPNQTYEKVVFDAWQQETWDANDTVELDILQDLDIGVFVNTFIQQYNDYTAPNTAYVGWKTNNLNSGKPEQIRAVQQSLLHANTPSTAHLDTLGRAFLNINRNGALPADEFHTRTTLDIQGNELAITDPRGLTCFQHQFDLQQRQLWIGSVDAGPKWLFPAVDKQVIWSKDANGNELVHRFDALRRPTQSWVKTGQATTYFLAQEQIYGELSTFPNAKGKVWKAFDGAGMIENLDHDFKGNLISTSRQLLQNKKGVPVWGQATDPWSSNAQADASLLSNEVFKTDSSFDALNRLIRHTLPNQVHKTFVYNKSNLLKATQVDGQDYVRSIAYNAKGQREYIEYGNGIRTEYTYEPSTYRLLTIKSSKGGQDFQDLHYTYDPVGNITQITDEAIEPIFFQNRKIEAVKYYHYDPLYRLIAASGRELDGASRQNTCENILFKQAHGIPLPQSARNQRALHYYAETYTYDKAGNITSKKHYTNRLNDDGSPRGNPVHSQTQTYATDSNRILSTTCAGYTKNCRHDDNGNLDNLYTGMFWDYNNRLVGVQKQIQNDEEFYTEAAKTNLDRAEIHYQYDSQGNRVTKLVGNKLRVYLGDYEQYTDGNASASITVHVMDDKSRVATIDTGPTLSSSAIRYHLGDHLGSAALEVDENGVIISLEEYLPYGGTAVWGYHATEISTKRYRYSGKERDEETGMYYYGARYYVGWMGRWVSYDVKSYKYPDWSPYCYTLQNPINLTDPDGKEVAVQVHEVLCSGKYHTSIRITPKNQEKYSNNPNFFDKDGRPNIDNEGRLYATIGAGPSPLHLESGINRENDVNLLEPEKVEYVLIDIKNRDEDEVIQDLFEKERNFDQTTANRPIDYDLFPANPEDRYFFIPDDGYNSNSFVAGLLNSTELEIPRLNFNTPGYSKPVPKEFFQSTTSDSGNGSIEKKNPTPKPTSGVNIPTDSDLALDAKTERKAIVTPKTDHLYLWRKPSQ